MFATGGVAGDTRITSEAGCRKALEPQTDGRDLILDIPVRFGLGFAVGGMPNPDSLSWGGYGGSLVIVDLDAHTVFAYTMNRMTGTTTGDDERALGLAFATWEAMLARS